MEKKDRDKVQAWAKRVGIHKARTILLSEGLSYSLGVMLTNGTYRSEPKERVKAAIQKAMKQL